MKGALSKSIKDGWDLVKEVKSGAVSETTDYLVYGGEVLAFERGGSTFYLHGDALSSTQLVTDENGNQVARLVHGAWGETLSSTESIPGLLETRFVGGLGVRNDSTTGLIYMRYRWYDPATGTFISRDPIGLHGGSNLYSYASNAPSDYVDPYGDKPYQDSDRVNRLINILLSGTRKNGTDYGKLIREYLKKKKISVFFDDALTDKGTTGECDTDSGKITLEGDDFTEPLLALILLHEFLHYAIWKNLSFVPKRLQNPRSIIKSRGHNWIFYEEALMYETLRNRGRMLPNDAGNDLEFYNRVLEYTRPGSRGYLAPKYQRYLESENRRY